MQLLENDIWNIIAWHLTLGKFLGDYMKRVMQYMKIVTKLTNVGNLQHHAYDGMDQYILKLNWWIIYVKSYKLYHEALEWYSCGLSPLLCITGANFNKKKLSWQYFNSHYKDQVPDAIQRWHLTSIGNPIVEKIWL